MQEDQLKDSIENEVNELSSVLDEMQCMTGHEIFDDLKRLNLQKCSNALKKDLSSDLRKTVSQKTFSQRTLKLALTALKTPDKLPEKDEFELFKTLQIDKRPSAGVDGRARAFSLEETTPIKKSSFKDKQRPNFACSLEKIEEEFKTITKKESEIEEQKKSIDQKFKIEFADEVNSAEGR